jgi:hypothetical protein
VPRGSWSSVTEASNRRMRPPLPGEGHSRPQSLTLDTLPPGLRSSNWSPDFSCSPDSEQINECGTTGQGQMPRPTILMMSVTIMSRRSVEFMREKPDFFISHREPTPDLSRYRTSPVSALIKLRHSHGASRRVARPRYRDRGSQLQISA